MIFALDKAKFISLIVALIVGTLCLMAVLDGGETSVEIWGRRGSVLVVITILVAALSVPGIFAAVHTMTFAKFWWFPRLDGEWEAHIRSNWPRIRQMYEAAQADDAQFDAMRDQLSIDGAAAILTKAKVTIRSSLVLISITLEPHGTNRASRTRFVRPAWRKPDLPELSYVYEQFDSGDVATTDSRRHFGAGVVTYDGVTDTITGEYWTQRREDIGFNTAGTIMLIRNNARKTRKAKRG